MIHPSHLEEERYVMTINSDDLMHNGDLERNVLLQEGDIIYVPPTPLAWVGLRLQELIGPVAPIGAALGIPGDAIEDMRGTKNAFETIPDQW